MNNVFGLTDNQVTDSRREHGWNILTPPKKQSLWRLYLEKYQDPIIQILLVAAAISLVLAIIEHQYIETIGIFIAIFLATTVGFIFEMDAAKKFDVLTQLNEEQKVKVIRNGQVQLIARKDIVVGDTVLIETGDEIPADGLLDDCNSLQIDESMLTGEPLSSKEVKSEKVGNGAESHAEESYAKNFVMRSTMVMNGRGRYVVTAVGDATEIGRVARSSSEKSDVKTPLNLQLDRLGGIINKIGFSLSIGAAVLFLGHDILVNPLWRTIGSPDADYVAMAAVVLKYFMMAVSLIVMAVPEGLPMAVTLALALNMRRMLKSNNLVRKLHACETMGAVTVICTDKTGTLTQNRMQVAEYCSPLTSEWEILKDCCSNDDGKDSKVSTKTPPSGAGELLFEAVAVNTTAHLDGEKGIGNPTEVALLLWLKTQGVDYREVRAAAEIVNQEPFSTETKQMTTTVRLSDGTTRVYKKGAPEIVMSQCEITDDERKEVEQILLGYQQKAMRTLALAYCCPSPLTSHPSPLTSHPSPLTSHPYKLQAVFGITDPLRTDVPGAVEQCHSAGIRIKIVTGDVDATAMEIARQIGLQGDSISGAEFNRLTDEEATEVAKRICVMSRARPQDKQRLVQLLQKTGEVVAVTGDGTNDAPALNHAHVGLSLGSGTNVAKEASDMTLLDDSFGSIAKAVMWGRSLYKNLQRFLFFQLTVNVVALLLVIAGSVVGTEMPLTVTQILWVNLIMDTFAALALSSLAPSREVMNDKPRSQSDFILSRSIIKHIFGFGLTMFAVMFVFLLYCERGIDLGTGDTNKVGVDVHELTLFFTTFVMMQMWNLFNARAIGSGHSRFRRLWAEKGLIIVLISIIGGQWLIVTFGGDMFRCVPISLAEWAVIICATSTVALIPELYRIIRR